ncbi:hypothetical protein JHK86_027874 [Glycine max]|nr:hypothetical protein JHK86_027874 [Glycine max]
MGSDRGEDRRGDKIEGRGRLGVANKDVSSNPNKSRRTNPLNRLEASSTLSPTDFPLEDYLTKPENVISTPSKISISTFNSQVISIVKEFPIRTLTVYEATMGNPSDTFDVDPRDNVIDKGPKPIEELVKL